MTRPSRPGRRARNPLVFLLAGVVVIVYWLPLVVWVERALAAQSAAVHDELPILAVVGQTLGISGLVAVAAITFAYPPAVLWRLSGRGARLAILVITVLPIITGFMARNYAWLGLLSTAGLPGTDFGRGSVLLYTRFGVGCVMTFVFVPVAFFILIEGTTGFTQSQVDGARTLGASERTILLRVLLPQTKRAALLAFGLIFSMGAAFFVTPHMIGGRKYSFFTNLIWDYIDIGEFGRASTLALIFLGVMAAPVFLTTVVSLRRRAFTTGR
jgi:ABC-type spermidine/putrescine transport system permease subunit I